MSKLYTIYSFGCSTTAQNFKRSHCQNTYVALQLKNCFKDRRQYLSEVATHTVFIPVENVVGVVGVGNGVLGS